MPSISAARPPKLRPRPRLRSMAAAPPEEVADGVWVLRSGLTRTMNVYLVRDAERGGVLVFDAGEKGMASPIVAAAVPHGGISRVVLGHGDTDHRGAAPALRAYADVLCHPDAVEQAQGSGGRDYWRPETLPVDVRLLHAFAHRFVWDGGPVHIDGTLREGDRLAGFEVIALPGHAPGLIGLWRDSDRVALVSDCFYMTDMHGRAQPPSVPLDNYNLDTVQARRSIRKLAALRPRCGLPWAPRATHRATVVAQLEAAAAA
jgi:hydroxyacylglutathione hydrolase